MTILDQIPDKRALALALFPNGKVYDASGRMHVGDWDGNPGQSCVVYLDQGALRFQRRPAWRPGGRDNAPRQLRPTRGGNVAA